MSINWGPFTHALDEIEDDTLLKKTRSIENEAPPTPSASINSHFLDKTDVSEMTGLSDDDGDDDDTAETSSDDASFTFDENDIKEYPVEIGDQVEIEGMTIKKISDDDFEFSIEQDGKILTEIFTKEEIVETLVEMIGTSIEKIFEEIDKTDSFYEKYLVVFSNGKQVQAGTLRGAASAARTYTFFEGKKRNETLKKLIERRLDRNYTRRISRLILAFSFVSGLAYYKVSLVRDGISSVLKMLVDLSQFLYDKLSTYFPTLFTALKNALTKVYPSYNGIWKFYTKYISKPLCDAVLDPEKYPFATDLNAKWTQWTGMKDLCDISKDIQRNFSIPNIVNFLSDNLTVKEKVAILYNILKKFVSNFEGIASSFIDLVEFFVLSFFGFCATIDILSTVIDDVERNKEKWEMLYKYVASRREDKKGLRREKTSKYYQVNLCLERMLMQPPVRLGQCYAHFT